MGNYFANDIIVSGQFRYYPVACDVAARIPMQKIYLLLRNNKQSGPHTLDELIRLQLRPFDLIWIEGKSTAWRYPSEIEELTKYTRQDEQPSEKTGYVESKPDLVLPKTSSKKQDQKKDNNHNKVYVKLPTHYDLSREVSDALNENIRSAQEHAEEKRRKEDEQLNTKYVRDLDDIREQYSEWIYQQQNAPKSQISPRRLWIAAVVIILLVGGFLAQKWATPSKNNRNAVVTDTLAKKSLNTDKSRFAKNKKSKSTGAKKSKSKKNESIKKTVDSTRKRSTNTSLPQQTDSTSTGVKTEVKKKVPTATIFQQIDVSYSRDTTHKEGISGLRFYLHNRSDFKLSVVAVHVFYHDAGHQVAKETVYFNNISRDGKLTTVAPDHKKASSVTYKLALVSTEDTILYGKD